jgi:hypothetical protein
MLRVWLKKHIGIIRYLLGHDTLQQIKLAQRHFLCLHQALPKILVLKILEGQRKCSLEECHCPKPDVRQNRHEVR